MVNIRKAKLDDAAELVEIYRPYVEKTAITYEYVVPSIEEFKERISNTLKCYPYFVALDGEEIVGYCYASAFKARKAYDWAVETSIYVKQGCHGQGIGKLLYQYLEEALKKMGITNVYACIAYAEVEDEYLHNDSMRFHEHLGYKLIGTFNNCAYKFERWYSMIWMEKFINEHHSAQDIKPFTEIRG